MKTLGQLLIAIVLFSNAGVALAETYPQRPVRVIVPTAPGGTPDVLARLITQKLSEKLGFQFVVENIPGAGHNIGMGVARRAKPDGYTILIAMSTLMVNPMIYASVPYDPVRDFAPVALVGTAPFVLVVNPDVPANTAAELIALIKASPGKYNFSSPGYGTTPHLLGELLRISFDLDLVHVPFNGAGPATNATLAGTTPISFPSPALAIPLVKQGKLRALAVTSLARLTELPEVPTVVEAGLPGEGADTIVGVLVPAGTPREIIDVLHREISSITAMPEMRQRFVALGFDPVIGTPEDFGAYIKAEIVRWSKVIRDAKIGSE